MDRIRLFATGLICFCAGGLYGWSALIAPLQAAFDVSTAQTGLVFSIAIVCFTLSVTTAPHLLQQTAPLRRLAIFASGGALSIVLASIAPNYLLFLASFSAGFGTFSGAIYISSLGVAAQSASPLQSTPFMVAAFGVGGAVFGPAWRLLEVTELGIAMLWPLAIALALSALLAWCISQSGVTVASPIATATKTVRPVHGTTLSLIWLIFAFGSFGGLMILGLAAKMLETAHASVALSSVTLAGIALGNTLGRISVAGFTKIMRPITSVFIALSAGGVGIILTLLDASSTALAAGMCLIAAGYGVLASAVPSLTRAIYGAAMFQRRFALIFSAWGVAGFFAPWITGAIFDATGSFDLAVCLALGATVFTALAATALDLRLRHLS